MNLGMDCAFLLDDAPERPLVARQSRKPRITTFFHRSRISNLNDLTGLLSTIPHEGTVKSLTGWLQLPKGRAASSHFERLRDVILQSDVMVTDTYHVAVNAVRDGVPTICIGNYCESQRDTLDDFKKKILFRDLGLSDCYFEIQDSQLSTDQVKDIGNKISCINQIEFKQAMRERVDALREQFHQNLEGLFAD